MNKRILTLLSLSLFTASLFSQVNWKALYYVDYLDTLDGLVYIPRTGKPYTGKVLDLYANGNKMMEGAYKDGMMDEIWTYYYPDGVTKAKGQFVRGDGGNIHEASDIPQNGRNGEWIIYYPNGNMNAKYQYIDGAFDQVKLEWHYNGNKKTEMHYVEGTLDGPRLEWYENGQQKLDYLFVNGKKDGEWIAWYNNGNKKHHYLYDRGKEFHTQRVWWSNGNKKTEGNTG